MTAVPELWPIPEDEEPLRLDAAETVDAPLWRKLLDTVFPNGIAGNGGVHYPEDIE